MKYSLTLIINISIEDVRVAIKHLKSVNLIVLMVYDNFINGSELLFSYISMLFSMVLTHGEHHKVYCYLH